MTAAGQPVAVFGSIGNRTRPAALDQPVQGKPSAGPSGYGRAAKFAVADLTGLDVKHTAIGDLALLRANENQRQRTDNAQE